MKIKIEMFFFIVGKWDINRFYSNEFSLRRGDIRACTSGMFSNKDNIEVLTCVRLLFHIIFE